MRAYVLKDSDFRALLNAIDKDPKHKLSEKEKEIHNIYHRFLNYHIVRWIEKMRRKEKDITVT